MIELPDELLARVDTVARRVLGSRDAVGQALADEVRRVSRVYTREREAIAREAVGPEALAARLRFFLPRDLPKIAGPLEELRFAGALPRRPTWRVLDLGAGLGTTTLGVARFARQHGTASGLSVVAVDSDRAALRVMEELCRDGAQAGLVPISLETRAADVRRERPQGPFDLVVLGLVLNELESDADARAELLAGLAGQLAEDGSIVVIEPALRPVSRELHAVRDRIVAAGGPLNVFAPCLRGEGCPMLASERDWCHEDLPVALPGPVAEIARAAGLRFERLTFSYLTLRRDGRSLREAFAATPGEPYRVVSQPLPSKGKLELFVCGAPGRARLVRLDRHRDESNAALDQADRGTLLTVEPGAPDEKGRLRSPFRVRARRRSK